MELAACQGATKLTLQHFAEAWAMQEGAAPGKNVFLARRWSAIDLSNLHSAA